MKKVLKKERFQDLILVRRYDCFESQILPRETAWYNGGKSIYQVIHCLKVVFLKRNFKKTAHF